MPPIFARLLFPVPEEGSVWRLLGIFLLLFLMGGLPAIKRHVLDVCAWCVLCGNVFSCGMMGRPQFCFHHMGACGAEEGVPHTCTGTFCRSSLYYKHVHARLAFFLYVLQHLHALLFSCILLYGGWQHLSGRRRKRRVCMCTHLSITVAHTLFLPSQHTAGCTHACTPTCLHVLLFIFSATHVFSTLYSCTLYALVCDLFSAFSVTTVC